MCSWPPEDDRIESFQRHVRDQAKAILGADLARSEKFTTSVMDGLDIRETLRNWHTGDLYVKVIPPSRGSIEVVVFLFDVPADPSLYTSPRDLVRRAHGGIDAGVLRHRPDEDDLVGPGIAQAEYGGALLPLPAAADPRHLDRPPPRLRRHAGGAPAGRRRSCTAASGTSRSSARARPPASWRRLARRFGRKIVHLPLKRFSGQLVERLRRFHVLNGKHVRSYAADFIRDT